MYLSLPVQQEERKIPPNR